MSEATTGLFNTTPVFPRLVLDETLKRARVETSEGTAVRVTSAAADLTPITDALGTQQDPAETPTVIGLLKNLIASGGGSGGGGSADYPLFKMQWNSISWLASGNSETKDLATLLSNQEQTIPDWTKYIVFIDKSYKNQCAIFPYITESGEVLFNFANLSSPSSGVLDVYTYTLGWTNYEGEELTHNQISLTPKHRDRYLVDNDTSDLKFNRTGAEPEFRQRVEYYVLFFDTDPVSISGGGGGSGDSITTYSFTLNNVNVTDITAPETDPPSSSDKTLVSKSYVDANLDALKAAINNAHLQRRTVLLTGQITYFEQGTVYPLESTFNINIPSWANRLRMGVQIASYGTTQGYVEFGLVSGTYTYTALNNQTNNYFIVNFSYNSSNKSITVNKIMRLIDSDDSYSLSTNTLGIISITAYGNFSF